MKAQPSFALLGGCRLPFLIRHPSLLVVLLLWVLVPDAIAGLARSNRDERDT